MRLNASMGRAAVTGLVLLAVVAGSGCSWWRKGSTLYADDVASRPLEVPPELETGEAVPVTGSVTASAMSTGGAAGAGAGIGFTAAGSRDEVYAKVGEVLGRTEGLSIASRAQLMGVYDVNYGGSNFLVRVNAVEAGAYVSAVDPRGLPASGEAPAKLVEALKVALGGR